MALNSGDHLRVRRGTNCDRAVGRDIRVAVLFAKRCVTLRGSRLSALPARKTKTDAVAEIATESPVESTVGFQSLNSYSVRSFWTFLQMKRQTERDNLNSSQGVTRKRWLENKQLEAVLTEQEGGEQAVHAAGHRILRQHV